MGITTDSEELKMRKIFLTAIFVATLTIVNICAAQDVWIEHWRTEGVDVYAMDETIDGYVTDTACRHFTVSTKLVKHGQLQEIIKWNFDKFRTDMWRYMTNKMDGVHTTVVIPRSPLFEFCMNRLGWSYRIKNNNGVKNYH